jgi:hypothetical protein
MVDLSPKLADLTQAKVGVRRARTARLKDKGATQFDTFASHCPLAGRLDGDAGRLGVAVGGPSPSPSLVV